MHRDGEATWRGTAVEFMQVTAVVSLYNKDEAILRCLTSIRKQTLPAKKILVVDDCSTDRSADVVTEAAFEDVELIRLKSNQGPGAARNIGVARTTTPWVAFLDADDEWEPTFLERVSAAIVYFDADFGSSGGTRQVIRRQGGGVQTIVRLLREMPAEAFDFSPVFWRIALRFMPLNSSSVIARRTAVLRVGGFPEDVRRMEDFTLWMQLWLHGRFVFVNQPLSISYIDSAGLTSGQLRYEDVRKFLLRMAAVLRQAIRIRRPGAPWLGAYFVRALFLTHLSYVSRRIRRLVRRGGRAPLAS